jgi:hypothetical protein
MSSFVGKRWKLLHPRASATRSLALALASTITAAYVTPAQAQVTQQGATHIRPMVVIRGSAPIPQIVTVRPREVPAYRHDLQIYLNRQDDADHDFARTLGNGYSVIPGWLVTGGVVDSIPVPLDSIGPIFAAFVPLPEMSLATPPRPYTIVKKQRDWCAPRWWCPKHNVKDYIDPEIPANFPRR